VSWRCWMIRCSISRSCWTSRSRSSNQGSRSWNPSSPLELTRVRRSRSSRKKSSSWSWVAVNRTKHLSRKILCLSNTNKRKTMINRNTCVRKPIWRSVTGTWSSRLRHSYRSCVIKPKQLTLEPLTRVTNGRRYLRF
jgi:hypothetical protein